MIESGCNHVVGSLCERSGVDWTRSKLIVLTLWLPWLE